MNDLESAMQAQVHEGNEYSQAWSGLFQKFHTEKVIELLDIFSNSLYDEKELRDRVYSQIVALNQLAEWFESKVNTGKLAAKNLKEMRK